MHIANVAVKNALCYISAPIRQIFDEIWYADANFHFQDGNMTKKKSKFYKSKMADRRHFENHCSAISQRHIVRLG